MTWGIPAYAGMTGRCRRDDMGGDSHLRGNDGRGCQRVGWLSIYVVNGLPNRSEYATSERLFLRRRKPLMWSCR